MLRVRSNVLRNVEIRQSVQRIKRALSNADRRLQVQGAPYAAMFLGQLQETPNGGGFKIYPASNTGIASTLTITSLHAFCDQVNGSGNTVIVVADSPKGTATDNKITLTIASSSFDAQQTGSVSIVTGDPVHVYCSQADGGHQDLQVHFTVKG